MWPVIEALLFDAVAREQLRDRRGAEQSVERALEFAEPEGVMLPFLLAPCASCSSAIPGTGPRMRPCSERSLACSAALRRRRGVSPRRSTEELSEAELRVVRYLPSNLKAPEIAAELFVSTNTVRTHIRHIYAKLGAHDRDAAVARARELGLIAPSLRSR